MALTRIPQGAKWTASHCVRFETAAFAADRPFFPDRLTEKLRQIPERSLSVLEAPAGYGKTTAVHWVLDGLPEPVYWYTAVESMPDNSFRWFVNQISQIDEDAISLPTHTMMVKLFRKYGLFEEPNFRPFDQEW